MSLAGRYAHVLETAQRRALEYFGSVSTRPVFPAPEALAGLSAFEEPLPERPSDSSATVEHLHRHGSPATVLMTGGRYFGFVSGGVLPAALAANWLAGAWDQNAGFWTMSPVASKLEEVAARWLLDVLELPGDTAVGFVTGSTMGCFSALAAARAAICARHGHDIARRGLRGGPPIRVVAGTELHPSNLRAAGYLGLGRDDVILVESDPEGRLRGDRLPRLDDATIVLLQAGNVNSGAFDAFAEIGARARERGAWVHVDGAFGLWARASAATRPLTDGIEHADSWNLDGHKWLNVPMDSGIFGCRHRQAVLDAFGVDAPYLVRSEHREPNRFTPELGRRARGVEIWAALRSLGRQGVADLVERCCVLARRCAAGLARSGFTILNDVCLNQVLFRRPSDAETGAVLEGVQRSGTTWIGPTRWQGHLAMRISCCSWTLDEADIDATIAALQSALHESTRGPGAGRP